MIVRVQVRITLNYKLHCTLFNRHSTYTATYNGTCKTYIVLIVSRASLRPLSSGRGSETIGPKEVPGKPLPYEVVLPLWLLYGTVAYSLPPLAAGEHAPHLRRDLPSTRRYAMSGNLGTWVDPSPYRPRPHPHYCGFSSRLHNVMFSRDLRIDL